MVFRFALETGATSAVIRSMTLTTTVIAQFLLVKELPSFFYGVENFTGFPSVVTLTVKARGASRLAAIFPFSLCVPVPFPST